MPMFSLSKGQRQQPPNSAASVGGAPASSAVAAASAETSAAEPATSGTVPSASPIRGAVDARESSAGAVSSDAAAEGPNRNVGLMLFYHHNPEIAASKSGKAKTLREDNSSNNSRTMRSSWEVAVCSTTGLQVAISAD